MQTPIIAVLTAALGAWVIGPASEADREAEIKACQQQRCASISDETDRATCRLNCRQAAEGKDRGNIIRWTEERSVGGPAPGQDTAPPPVRTVTTVTPRGEITETNAPAAPTTRPTTAPTTTAAPKPPPTPRQRYYFGLVGCQDRCDPIAEGPKRARCKLQCLRRQPGPPPPRTQAPAAPAAAAPTSAAPAAAPTPRTTPAPASAPSRPPASTKSAAPSQPAVDCSARCAGEATEDDRQTCEATCRYNEQRKARPTTGRETTTVTVRPAECRRLCSERATRCREDCAGQGSDASTCRLQCDQTAASCERRCG